MLNIENIFHSGENRREMHVQVHKAMASKNALLLGMEVSIVRKDKRNN